MKVYRHVAALLAQHGVHTMFGLLGDANMHLASAFESNGGRLVRAAHEVGAVSMADVCARMSGRWSVATVTHGPGFTNTITALLEASRFGSPVLVITGDTPAEATHMQRLDHDALCASIGVAYERVHRPDSVVRDVTRAIRRLESTPAPVVLNVPVPIAMAESTGPQHSASTLSTTTAPGIDPDALDSALGLAASASRPVVLAGRGVVSAGAQDQVVELAEALGAALFTSGLGLGLFDGHPRHLGIMGSIAHDEATSVLAECDCVIAFGTSLNKYTSFGGELFTGKSLVQIDSEPVKLGWYVEPTCGVVGDARQVAEAMTAGIREGRLPEKNSWKARCADASLAVRQSVPPDDRSTDTTIDIRVATRAIDAILPRGCVVVSDVGRFIAGSWRYLTATAPGRFTAMTGFGSIGLGLAGGIGAALSGVGDLTVVLVGDGGFMMHLTELTTAVRERAAMVVLVYNDGAYGAEYQKLLDEGFPPDHAYNQWPDITTAAAGLGADTLTVVSTSDIPSLRKAIDELGRPLVVDIRLDPTHHLVF